MKRLQIIYLVPVFIVSSVLCSNAFGYKVDKTWLGKVIKWNTNNVTYYVNTSGDPSNSLSAIQSSAQTWTDVSTSSFSFSYGGATTSTAVYKNDKRNIICFGSMGEGVLARNGVWSSKITGKITDSDIKINTYYSWATDGSADKYDIQSVVTHELGHSLRLLDLYEDSDVNPTRKTMYYKTPAGNTEQRTLEQDDMDGITYLYP